jgi:hypothetical protein
VTTGSRVSDLARHSRSAPVARKRIKRTQP